MSKFAKALLLLIVFNLILRIIPILSNNFYWTVDQGWDAIYVREILYGHTLVTRGPETTIRGIFAGPLWYYFKAIGFFFSGGHPLGGLAMLILLHVFIFFILYDFLSRRLDRFHALFILVGLSGYWWFFDTARYAFNPFPLVILTISMAIMLIRFLEGRRSMLIWSFVMVFLAYNTHVLGAAVMLGVWIVFGLWGLRKGLADIRVLGGVLLLLIIFGLGFVPKAMVLFSGSGQLQTGGFVQVGQGIMEIVGRSVAPQDWRVGLFFALALTTLFFRGIKRGMEVKFVCITALFIFFSFIIVGFGKIYRDWYLVSLPTLAFISVALMLFKLGKWGRVLFALIIILQVSYFTNRYSENLKLSDDKSILANQIKVVDKVYEMAHNDGFAVYTYTDSFLDYHSQYLIWWMGTNQYKYLPCEYGILPYTDKVYVPGWTKYNEPTKWCDRYRFLIVESDTNGETNADWIDKYRQITDLVEEARVGNVAIEKREINSLHNEYYFRDVIMREYRENEMAISIPSNWRMEKFPGRFFSTNDKKLIEVSMIRRSRGCTDVEGIENRGPLDGLGLPNALTTRIIGDNETNYIGQYRGEVNEYVVSIYLRGVMKDIETLPREILKSVKLFEDANTPKETLCS